MSPGLTPCTRLDAGAITGYGKEGRYHRLAEFPGEPHVRRLDLVSTGPGRERGTSLLRFAHLTDMHVVDTTSPGRLEFAERFHGPEAMHPLLPAYRPQECVHLHACEAMMRTLTAMGSGSGTGANVQLLLCTGDATDNAQVNELAWVLKLLNGGELQSWKGGAEAEGVESDGWGDPTYWHPSEISDDFKERWGFPSYPGLLDDASRPFTADGVGLPWLACYGNHDGLISGTAPPSPAYERIYTGSSKARSFPPGFNPLEHMDRFIREPELFQMGPAAGVAPDESRRPYSRRDFVTAHLETEGEPAGHGFSGENLSRGTAYYADDRFKGVRMIVLDTVNAIGDFRGSIGAAQYSWLEERLIDVHSRYRDDGGREVRTGTDDRLVIVASHHGRIALVNDLAHEDWGEDLPRILGEDVEALLHRFPNVILWINGHIHANRVWPRPDASGRGNGFWEVTTCSLIDWPCQARLIELVSGANGMVSIVCTMVDHSAPADPRDTEGGMRMAAIHRELAAHDPHRGMASGKAGTTADRNVELVLPAPFPLE